MKIWVIEPDETCVVTRLKDHINRLGQEMQRPETVGSEELIREERRLYPRVPCFLLADYVTQGCAYTAFIKNICADGAFIEAPRPVPPDRISPSSLPPSTITIRSRSPGRSSGWTQKESG